jgi:5'-3' exonuclease
MTRILLCEDMSYQVYRASAAHPMLTSRRTFTGGLYGFLTTFAKTVRETRATDVVFCQDVKPYLRSRDYPEYKLLRKKNADDELLKMYQSSMALVLELLGLLGFTPWGIPGFESDDLIAHAARKYRHRFTEIYAGSNDSDLYQLFTLPNFHVYRDGIANLMDGRALMKNSGFTPDQFMLASAIQGTHNDIAGLPGVGPVTARRAVTEPAVMRKMREKGAAIIDRNLALIKLPHPEFPHEAALPVAPTRFDARAFNRFLSVYDIDVTATMERAFQQLTEGDR